MADVQTEVSYRKKTQAIIFYDVTNHRIKLTEELKVLCKSVFTGEPVENYLCL